MPAVSTRVLVAEDYPAFRQFLASTIHNKAELQLICEVADGSAAVLKTQELQPDLILLDIGMPGLNGIEAARRIRKLSPNSKILFVSENRSSDVIEEALRTGALGYVVKSDAARDLLPAIEGVLQGKEFVSASVSVQPRNSVDKSATDRVSENKVLPFRFRCKTPRLWAIMRQCFILTIGNFSIGCRCSSQLLSRKEMRQSWSRPSPTGTPSLEDCGLTVWTLMRLLSRASTSPWMLLTRCPPSWSMRCLIRVDS